MIKRLLRRLGCRIAIAYLEWEMDRDRVYFRACRSGGVLNEPELDALRRAMSVRDIRIMILEAA